MAVNGYDDLSAYGWSRTLLKDEGTIRTQDESGQVVLRAEKPAQSAGTPGGIG